MRWKKKEEEKEDKNANTTNTIRESSGETREFHR